jgi:hypothetical protein
LRVGYEKIDELNCGTGQSKMATNCESCSKLLSNCECCPRCLKDDYGCNCICESDKDCVQRDCYCRLNDALVKEDLPKVDSYLAECSTHKRVFDTSWKGWCIYTYTRNDEKFIKVVKSLDEYKSSIEGIDDIIHDLEDKIVRLDCCKHREVHCKAEYELTQEIDNLSLVQRYYAEIKDTYSWNLYLTFKKYKMEYVF